MGRGVFVCGLGRASIRFVLPHRGTWRARQRVTEGEALDLQALALPLSQLR
jgi:hypothetical protein